MDNAHGHPGAALREFRLAAGVAMGDILAALDTSEPTLSRIERGKSPVAEGFETRYREAVREVARQRFEAAQEEDAAPQLVAA